MTFLNSKNKRLPLFVVSGGLAPGFVQLLFLCLLLIPCLFVELLAIFFFDFGKVVEER